MIKYIFFDFDGTVSDAKHIAVKSLLQTLEELDYKFDRKKAVRLLGDKMNIVFEKLGLPMSGLKRARRVFYEHFTEAAVNGKIKLCVSVKPLWELSRDYPLIVVSNSETYFVKASIKTLKLKKLFRRVHGAEKFGTKDELLKKLFKKYKIKPSEAMYVGDRFSDIEFARKAGCISVAIHNKCAWSSLKELIKEKPDYIVRDFRGLKKVVDGINSESD